MLFELGVRWSLIGGDVIVYQFDHRLPLRANITQDYAESAPRDATVEAHATHLLATLLQQSEAVGVFEFDGVELVVRCGEGARLEALHLVAIGSLGQVLGCNVALFGPV